MSAKKEYVKISRELLNDPFFNSLEPELWRTAIILMIWAAELRQAGNLPELSEIAERFGVSEDRMMKLIAPLIKMYIVEFDIHSETLFVLDEYSQFIEVNYDLE